MAWKQRAGRIERLVAEAVTTTELKQASDAIEKEMAQVTATYDKWMIYCQRKTKGSQEI